MAFVNLPPNLQDIFYSITDRIAKLETGPNQAMYYAESAQSSSSQALAEAAAADAKGTLALAEATAAIAQGTQAIQTANAALQQANTAYALGAQSLQKSANTITNASNQLTAINGTGITVYSGASATTGARVVLNSAGLAGFNSAGTSTFAINASTGAVSTNGAIFTSSTITGGSLNINGACTIDSAGVLYANGATIIGNITATSGTFTGTVFASAGSFTGTITSANATITGGSLTVGPNFQVNSLGQLTASSANITGTINASSGTIGGFTIASTYLSGSGGFTLYSNGTIDGGLGNSLFYGYINVGGGTATGERFIVTGNSSFVGQAIFSNNVTSQTHFFSPFAANVTSAANGFWVTSGSGRMTYTTASSERYKHDIVDLLDVPEYDPKKLLSLPVRAFRYNQDYVTPTDDRAEILIPGFIAEEVDEIYPIGCDYSENNGPESWNDRVLLPAMLALIQDQEKRITQLEGN